MRAIYYLILIILVANPAYAVSYKLPKNAPIQQINFVYNKAFAKRFGFDLKKARKLSKGLYAIKYVLDESSDHSNMIPYNCEMILYLDNKMDVAYPEGDALKGDYARYIADTVTVFSGLHEVSAADNARSKKIFNAYNSGRFLILLKRTSHWEETHDLYGVVVLGGYNRSLLPGIAVLRFGTGCDALAVMQKGAAVWMGKRGVGYVYKTKSGRYVRNKKSYNVITIPISKTFQKYAKFAACVYDNRLQDDICGFFRNFSSCKHRKPNPDCFKLLPAKQS